MAVKDLPEITRAARGVDLRAILKSTDLFGAEPIAGVSTA